MLKRLFPQYCDHTFGGDIEQLKQVWTRVAHVKADALWCVHTVRMQTDADGSDWPFRPKC